MIIRNRKRRLAAIAGFLLVVMSRAAASQAAGGLTTIDNPQGGEIVFFTAVKHAQGDAPIAGLIIATRSAPDRVEAALVSDDAGRFGSTINPMLKTLFGAWHLVSGGHDRSGASERSANGSGDVPALHKATTADGSASGWNRRAISVAAASALSVNPPERCARLSGTIDPKDDKGTREFTAVFCSGGVSPMGQLTNVVDLISIPERLAARERATAAAILASYAEDASVVGAQASQMAAPEIARIHAIGQRAAQQAASAHAAEDAQNASVEKHWDAEDRNSQAFGNYLLDQTVIQDNQNDAHATVWNSTADAMVRGNPDRYQYVDSPNLWKGVDY